MLRGYETQYEYTDACVQMRTALETAVEGGADRRGEEKRGEERD